MGYNNELLMGMKYVITIHFYVVTILIIGSECDATRSIHYYINVKIVGNAYTRALYQLEIICY